MLTEAQQRVLMGSLNPDRVAHRKQSGQNLSYLEAWDVKATLIRVFGFGGFDAEVIQSAILDTREVPKSKGDGTNIKVTAQATVRLHIKILDATYTETAIGGSAQGDITEAMDMAIKTAESDALKRAAIYLGTQFGLSLYDNGSTSDVVRLVVAPGQEWNSLQGGSQRNTREGDKGVAESSTTEQAEAIVAESSLSEEDKSEAQALVERALSAKRARDLEQPVPGDGEGTATDEEGDPA